MKEFAQHIATAENFGPQDVPLILHYDDRVGDLRPWGWPSKGGIPVRPEELDRHRYTHCFKAPSCLCPFENGPSSFSEVKIGLAHVLRPGTPHYSGEYIAICATQQCGYIVKLERYFCHPKLMLQEYQMRAKPIVVMDPFTFVTGDTEESIKKTGLQQICVLTNAGSNTVLRGTNRLLKREDPELFLKLQGMLKKLMIKGLPAEKFWDLFIQCTGCNFVMPRQYFPYYHPCITQVVHRQLGLPKTIPLSKEFEETVDNILAEDDLDYSSSDDELPNVLSLFAPTSRIKSYPDRVDPNEELTLGPK